MKLLHIRLKANTRRNQDLSFFMLHLLQWEPFKHLLLLFSLFFSASSFFKATLTNPKVFRRREANPLHTSLKQKLRTTEVEMKAKTHQQRGGIWWGGANDGRISWGGGLLPARSPSQRGYFYSTMKQRCITWEVGSEVRAENVMMDVSSCDERRYF